MHIMMTKVKIENTAALTGTAVVQLALLSPERGAQRALCTEVVLDHRYSWLVPRPKWERYGILHFHCTVALSPGMAAVGGHMASVGRSIIRYVVYHGTMVHEYQ